MSDRKEVPRKEVDLSDNRELVSRPIIVGPLYRCATVVVVIGYEPHADIDVEVNGGAPVSAPGAFPEPDGVTVRLAAPLGTGDQVRARQRTSVTASGWTDAVTVGDHTQDYPAGPPRPNINPAPPYACGARTGVSNLLIGGNVWITADNGEVGRVDGCSDQQGVNVNPDYDLNQRVRAWFELCGDPSPPSLEYLTGKPPSPLPQPGIDTTYEDGEQVRITNIVNGARVTVVRNGINMGTWSCWGGGLLVGLAPPHGDGDLIEASQRMCPGEPDSPTGSTVVEPCANLPAPKVGPVQIGDDRITLTDFEPDAVIKVFVNGQKVAEGGGAVIQLETTIQRGDVIHVLQELGDCRGETVREVTPLCVDPPFGFDPSALDLFPVGTMEYADGDIKGSVYYPANDDGANQPFNKRLAEVARAPIVFLAHGNHGTHHDPNKRNDEWFRRCGTNEMPPAGWIEIPNYQGYDYFQQQLARMGIVAVSVDCNATNCRGGGPSNIEERAVLIIGSIDFFQNENADPGSTFNNKLDFGSVGIMGHSRGGDAVVLVPEMIALPGVDIKAVLALAPTSFGPSSGRPRNYDFQTVLPAGDGDVWSNDGAKFYDQARPDRFKSQLYVHFANHNYFNRQWPGDDSNGPPVMSRYNHERILSVYGCAFFRSTLLDHGGTIAVLSGRVRPSGTATGNVQLSFEWRDAETVDNHEDGNGIGLNSLDRPTAPFGGLVANEFPFRDNTAAFNRSFFGNSIGMVVERSRTNGEFRSELKDPTDFEGLEVWVRCAEVYVEPNVPTDATGFELGLEDSKGEIARVDSDEIGGLPRPYHRRMDDLASPWIARDATKSMLKTLRFPSDCFEDVNPEFNLGEVVAIRLRTNRRTVRPLAFDDLQIVKQP